MGYLADGRPVLQSKAGGSALVEWSIPNAEEVLLPGRRFFTQVSSRFSVSATSALATTTSFAFVLLQAIEYKVFGAEINRRQTSEPHTEPDTEHGYGVSAFGVAAMERTR